MLEEGRRDSGLAVPSVSEIYGPVPTRVGKQHTSLFLIQELGGQLGDHPQQTTNSGVNLETPLHNKCGQPGDHTASTAFLFGRMPTTSFTGTLPFHSPLGNMPLASLAFLYRHL